MFGLILAPLAALLQGDDVLAWPLIVAVLALLAISGVASAITAGLRRLPTTIKPQSLVYVVSGLIVTVGFFMAGGKMPIVDPADPAGTVTAWLLLVTLLARFTQTFYDVVLHRVLPPPEPDIAPAP